MPILNYTTQVDANKTVGEIYGILARSGAKEISTEYHNGQTSAIRFVMIHADHPLCFRIEPRPDGVLKSMQRDNVAYAKRTAIQAHRVAWRIMKNAVEAQIAIFESQQGDMAEVFLPYAIDGKGDSFYKIFTDQRIKSLNPAPEYLEEQ